MDAPAGTCSFCGADRRVEAHHITGRDPNREHLHPDFTVDLCRRHHDAVHAELRVNNIDVSPTEVLSNVLVRVGHVLRRIAVFLGCYAPTADNPVWKTMAAVLERLATDIDDALTSDGVFA
jgi:hypothetical protein